MKKKFTPRSLVFNLRGLLGLLVSLAGVLLALLGFADAQNTASQIIDINPDHAGFSAQPLVGIGDCPPPCPSGGSGGRVNGLAAVFGDPFTYFAASEVGGLFKSTDAGSSWAHLDGHVPTRTWDVAAAPGGHRIYATSFYDWRVQSQSGIQVSGDGGATWSRPPISPPVTCAPARATEPSAFGIALRPGAPAEVLIGTNCGIARSTDAGVTWTQFDPTPGDATNSVWDVVALPGGLTYACGDDGLLTSSDGQTWTSLGKPPNFRGGYCSLAVSPDEPFVVFVVFAQPTFSDYFVPRGGVFWEYDGDVSGNKWTRLPNPDDDSRIPEPKRRPIVRTNKRSQGFDLWLGAGNLLRAHCETPATPGPRCPTVLLSPPEKWSGGFTDVYGDLTKAHGDSGDLVFDLRTSVDACPTLYSSDGGIYRNEPLFEADCHANARFMPVNVGVHALLLLGMEGVHRLEEEIYLALMDNGLFYTHNAGSNSPTWQQRFGGDANDVVADALRVVTSGAYGKLLTGDPGFTNMHPVTNALGWDYCVDHGTMEVIDQVPDPSVPGEYVMAIGAYDPTKCTFPNGDPIPKGVRLTSSIDSNPFGSPLGSWTSAASPCNVRASMGSSGLEVFVQAGSCDWSNPDQLWKYADGNWTQITPVGGIAMFAVDPVNPRRLYAATVGGGNSEMLRSDTGGTSWIVDEHLTDLMHGFGAFVRQAQDNGDGVTYPYVQATFVAFDPENPNILVAGGRESGVFVSSDGGASWARITDPFTPGTSHVAHLPRPFFAQFDHEPAGRTSVYIGTAGRGVWRIDFANAYLDGAAIWHYTGTPCTGDSCPGWQRWDNNSSSVAIVSDGQELYQLHNNGKIWQSTHTPCTADSCPGWRMLDNNTKTIAIAAAGGRLYQLHNDGMIWVYMGVPCSGNSCPSWKRLDNNTKTIAIAAGGNNLFQLHNDGMIWRYTGTPCTGDSCPGWQQLDRNQKTTAIAAAGGELYQLHNDGMIWRYTGTPCTVVSCPGWQRLDNNPKTVALIAAGDRLYQLHDDGMIWRYTGTPCSGNSNSCPGWQRLDNNSRTGMVAAGDDLYQLHTDPVYQLHNTGWIWRYTGEECDGNFCNTWERLDNNPNTRDVIGAGAQVFQRHQDGKIWRYTGTPCSGDSCPSWQMIDNNPATIAIAAAGAQLFQLHNDGTIWRYTGTPCSGASCPSWQRLDNNPATVAIAAGENQLFQLHRDGRIWRYTGTPCSGDSCPGWQMLDNNPNTRKIVAARNQLFQMHQDGRIWRYTGTPCSGNSCPSWQMLDNNPNTIAIAAGGNQLVQLHRTGLIWRYTGVPCSGNSCPGWQELDNNPRTHEIAVTGTHIYQRHDNGAIWRFTGPPCSGNSCPGWRRLDNNPRTSHIAVAGFN